MAQAEKIAEEFYNKPVEQIFTKYKVDPIKGLTSELAQESLTLHGKNELKKKKRSFWKVIVAPVINLLIIIYLIGVFSMWVLGEVRRTLPNFFILGINAVIAIVQQLRAEKQMEALKKLSAATATVIRNGQEVTLPTEEIVIGDIIKFKQGDKIPADARILEGRNLSVNESSLTGETEPVRKASNSAPIEGIKLPLQDQRNMVFLGTFVSLGQGTAVVTTIGSDTELGKISKLLEESSTGEIPLRQKMNNFAKFMGLGVVVLLVISLCYKTYLLSLIGPIEWITFRIALLNSIDTGMKVMPINLPLLTTIVLLTGVLAMAQKGVIVRELSRTESLGRVSVVCSDKTGTMTKNEMTVVRIWTLEGAYIVKGIGYDPQGIVCNEGSERKAETPLLDLLVLSAHLNNNASIKSEQVKTIMSGDNKFKTLWSINGLPTEASLVVLAKKYNTLIEEKAKGYTFIHEFSFDSAVKRMSKIYKSNGKNVLFAKGATEWILPLCTQYYQNNIKPLDEKTRQIIMKNMQESAGEGYRVLTITYREVPDDEMPIDWDQEKLRENMDKNLIFLGFVVILDPPREDVANAVKECHKAGVNVVMITGDSISTGKAIANTLGIYNPANNLAKEGKDLEKLTDEEFIKTSCYGRVSPEHKQVIIERYQKMNRLVSMTGDGVNDALALSMADCGLAMGIQGTEVAKEAADMIITDDSFSTIVTGIREGRGLFMKIRMMIYFFIGISLMEALILFSATFFPDPNYVMFDFWQLNLLYVTAHALPSLGFVVSKNSRTIMEEKPRDSAEIIPRQIFLLMIIHISLMGLGIILAFYLTFYNVIPINSVNMAGLTYTDAYVNLAQSKARTMGFVVLYFVETLIMPMQIRRINQPITESFRDINYKAEFPFYILSIAVLIIIIYWVDFQVGMEKIGWPLNFMYLGATDWIICIALCLPSLFGFELVRWYARERKVYF